MANDGYYPTGKYFSGLLDKQTDVVSSYYVSLPSSSQSSQNTPQNSVLRQAAIVQELLKYFFLVFEGRASFTCLGQEQIQYEIKGILTNLWGIFPLQLSLATQILRLESFHFDGLFSTFR